MLSPSDSTFRSALWGESSECSRKRLVAVTIEADAGRSPTCQSGRRSLKRGPSVKRHLRYSFADSEICGSDPLSASEYLGMMAKCEDLVVFGAPAVPAIDEALSSLLEIGSPRKRAEVQYLLENL